MARNEAWFLALERAAKPTRDRPGFRMRTHKAGCVCEWCRAESIDRLVWAGIPRRRTHDCS